VNIQNQIEIDAPPDELFEILSDVERVAPLLPGASLEGKQEDGSYAGTVKVKVGPISVTYQGTLYFAELDHGSRKAVIEASGQETNGQGSTQATITATVSGSDSTSVLNMNTDMEVRGKVAQFGRGAIDKVSQNILDQFAHNLEAQVLSGGETTESVKESAQTTNNGSATHAAGSSEAGSDNESSLNALSLLPVPTMRQALTAVVSLLLGLVIGALLKSRGTRNNAPPEMGPAAGKSDYPTLNYPPFAYPPLGYAVSYPPPQWSEIPPSKQR
jgi:carbon monoxide dehydrogenase subunit G